MSQFQIDVNAAQSLLTDLNQTDQVLGGFLTALKSANNAFDPGFVSPDKVQFEGQFQVIINDLQLAQGKSEELRNALTQLLSYVD